MDHSCGRTASHLISCGKLYLENLTCCSVFVMRLQRFNRELWNISCFTCLIVRCYSSKKIAVVFHVIVSFFTTYIYEIAEPSIASRKESWEIERRDNVVR